MDEKCDLKFILQFENLVKNNEVLKFETPKYF